MASRAFNRREREGFCIATLAIEPLQLGGEFLRAGRVARGEELDHVRGNVHAAGRVDARGEAKGHVEAGELFGCGVEGRGGEEGAQARADGLAQLA